MKHPTSPTLINRLGAFKFTQSLPNYQDIARTVERQVSAAINEALGQIEPGQYLAVKVCPPPPDSGSYTMTLRTCLLGQPLEGERWPRLPDDLVREGDWTIYYRLAMDEATLP